MGLGESSDAWRKAIRMGGGSAMVVLEVVLWFALDVVWFCVSCAQGGGWWLWGVGWVSLVYRTLLPSMYLLCRDFCSYLK